MNGSPRPASLATIVAALALAACSHPSLDGYPRQHAVSAGHTGPTVKFLGVSTLVIEAEGTAVATDGFFTRPGMWNVLFGHVGPNEAEIDRVLRDADITKLNALFTVHSHYDHAMDAPVVARKTHAELRGSESTHNIARGVNSTVKPPFFELTAVKTFHYPPFTVTAIPSVHGPTSDLIDDDGEVGEPLRPPAYFTDYKDGGCYALHFAFTVGGHKRAILVHASAGVIDDTLKPYPADVVYLGIARVGNMEEHERERYWNQVVKAVGARRVIPIHWDDFFEPLDKTKDLQPMPRFMHDFADAMEFLKRKGEADNVEIVLPIAWHKTDPFEDLPAN